MRQKKWISLVPVMTFILMLTVSQTASATDEDYVKTALQRMNNQLTAAGEDFRIECVDLETYDRLGIRVYANDRQHQLDAHWLPYDPWRFSVRDIYWAIDSVDQAADVAWADAVAAISRAMNTWNTVTCANIPLTQVNDGGYDLGYVQYLLGMGGLPGWFADITHAGWLPREFFDLLEPGGGDFILGATFTFVWTARPGDVAFREIYENEEFSWGIDIRYFDIETVVAHEVGHGLSLGHFGRIFRSEKNDKLHFAPRALMNAIYYDILHELLGTDISSFCSIWASWPIN